MPDIPPRVVVFAGPNGSGKSTLTARLRTTLALGFPFPAQYVNADEIAADLRLSGDSNPEVTAFHRGRELRGLYPERGLSFAYETVLSHPSGLIDLQRLRNSGYQVTLVVVVTADPELNVARVSRRVLAGGHDVPADRIRSRYERFFRFLPRVIEIADDAWIFDATDRIELCLRAREGVVHSRGTVPPFLQHGLVDALAKRNADRLDLLRQLNSDVRVQAPDENGGSYGGVVAVAGDTALLQQLSKRVSVLHDRSLLLGSAEAGSNVSIRYHEGYGHLEQQVG